MAPEEVKLEARRLLEEIDVYNEMSAISKENIKKIKNYECDNPDAVLNYMVQDNAKINVPGVGGVFAPPPSQVVSFQSSSIVEQHDKLDQLLSDLSELLNVIKE